MKFFRLAYYDVRNFLFGEWKKLLVIFSGFFVICLTFCLKEASILSGENSVGTFGDYWLYIFGGFPKVTEDSAIKIKNLKMLAMWLAVLLYLFYTTLYYPFNDLTGYGQNVLTRSRGRRSWWLSKCLWNALTVLMFFCIGAAVVFLFCVVTKKPISLKISQGMYTHVFLLDDELASGGLIDFDNPGVISHPSHITGALIGMPLLTAVAISELQMFLSLWLRPMFSFGVTVIILGVSAYCVSPFLIGNYAMPIRCDALMPNGVSPLTGTVILTSLIAFCVIAGDIAFKRYDILNKEN